jgi:ABC-type amino acid transport system permease subunit
MKTIGHSAYIKAWLVYTLGATILGGIMGTIMGGFLGLILTSAGVLASQIKTVTVLVGLVIGIPFSYFMFWVSIKTFIVSKLPGDSAPAP